MSGFQVFNDGGTLQFDSEMPNFCFVGKGTLTSFDLSDPSAQSNWGVCNTSNVPSHDTVAYRCTTSPVYGGFIGQADRTDLYATVKGGTHTVEYFLFRRFTTAASVPTAGIEVYDVNGRLTFSSAYRPLAVIQKEAVTNGYAGMSEGRATLAGKKCAFIPYGSSYRQYRTNTNTGGDIGGSPFTGATPGFRAITNGFFLEEIVGNQVIDGNNYNGGVLVIDVTAL